MKWIACFLLLTGSCALAQTTQPDDVPTTEPAAVPEVQPSSADQVLNQMLRPSDTDRPDADLSPQPAPTVASIPQAISPSGSTGPIWREGTDIVDRVGRLKKDADAMQQEFTFESDGRALQDPPVILLPNLLLMQMETALNQASHDLRFRITGTVTEYHGRNYLLLERFVVVQDKNQEF